MKVNGKDDIPYIIENNIHVWNHQPELVKLLISRVYDDLYGWWLSETNYEPYICENHVECKGLSTIKTSI